jgi:hypothetical protein
MRLRAQFLLLISAVFAFAAFTTLPAGAEPVQASKAVYSSDIGGPPLLQSISAVCCKRGAADWWAPSVRRCHAAGGFVAAPAYCRVDSYRVCCKRGRADWWAASPGVCRHRGGYVVHPAYCRR